MKAIKKPVEINFILYTGNVQDVIDFVESFGQKFQEHFNCNLTYDSLPFGELSVKTLEGSSYNLIANKHAIIRGVRGEFYPCEWSIFQETYDVL